MAQIAEVIKYEGDNSTFVWKHPCEDFNTLTQLIVHESQEAIFMMNGQALDLFGAGRYTLETGNIPLLGKHLNKIAGDTTPFHCEVYFINKTVQMDVKWGTDSKVRYVDPDSGVPLALGACGSMNIAVSDSRKLLIKLVGTMSGIAWDEQGTSFTKSVQNSFKPLISVEVKSNLTQVIKDRQIDIFEVDEHLDELSKELLVKIRPGFEEYGITIPQFYVTNVLLPDDDPNFKRLKELRTITLQTRVIKSEAVIKTARIQSDAEVGAAQAQAEASVIAARRGVEMEKQTTQTEIARREAERKSIEAQGEAAKRIIGAQAEAEGLKMHGLADAEVMKAKGYSEKDVLQADVQKAFAEGLGNMGANGGGTSSAMSDILGLGIGLQAAGAMGGKINGLFNGMTNWNENAPVTKTTSSTTCNKCGAKLPAGAKFCLECGEKVVSLEVNQVTCPSCGKVVSKGKFCLECGYRFVTVCPKCGYELTSGAKFCLECGEKL